MFFDTPIKMYNPQSFVLIQLLTFKQVTYIKAVFMAPVLWHYSELHVFVAKKLQNGKFQLFKLENSIHLTAAVLCCVYCVPCDPV